MFTPKLFLDLGARKFAQMVLEPFAYDGLLNLDGFEEFFHGTFDDVFLIDDDISLAFCLLSDAAGIAETNGRCDKQRNGSFYGLHRSVLARCGLKKQEVKRADRSLAVINTLIVAYGCVWM